MKNIPGYILVFIILVAPLYPALLTDDLRVVIPTGNPFLLERCEVFHQTYPTVPGITLRVIKTRQGVLLIREQSKPWITLSTPIGKIGEQNEAQHILKLLQKYNMKAGNDNINVILE